MRSASDAVRIVMSDQPSDILELRLDYLESLDSSILRHLMEKRNKLILTVREPSEGGRNRFTDANRLQFFTTAREMGFMTDIEAKFLVKYGALNSYIASFHKMEGILNRKEIEYPISSLSGRYTYFKIAAPATRENRLALIELVQTYGNVAAMELGGEPMYRIAFSILGSKLLYCSLGERTAEGQMDCKDARDIITKIWVNYDHSGGKPIP